ncbi:MAG: CdaR family protein [Chloroflexota bacterium]|nr:CdaR family protein [Chloroflexota bacterium]
METETSQVGPRRQPGPTVSPPEDLNQSSIERAGTENGDNGSDVVGSDGIDVAIAEHYAAAEPVIEEDVDPSWSTLETSPLVSPRSVARRPALSLPRIFPDVGLDDRLGRVLLSAVLALLLWFYVVNLENPEQITIFKGLPVDVRGAGSNIKVLNSPLPPVDATVQAPQNVMANLTKSDIRPYVDLTGLSGGVHDLPIVAQIPGAQGGEANVTLSPNSVQVQLEAQITRTFTITVQTQGNPTFGYGLEPPQVNPGHVQVTGSAEAVGRIAQVVVQVDVEQKSGTQQGSKQPVALDSSGAEIPGLSFDPSAVSAVVPIKQLLNYKLVPVRVPVQGQPAPGYRVASITFNPTNVTVCCLPNLINTLPFLDTNPVPITGTTSTVQTTTELLLPPGVELYRGESRAISVTVGIEVLETTLQVSVVPTVEGVGRGLSAVISPSKLDLTLAGTFSQLQTLKPSDIRAVIRVDGRGPGTYQLVPDIVLPQGVKLEGAAPGRITVTLVLPTSLPATPTPTRTPIIIPTSTTVPSTATKGARPAATDTRTVIPATATHTALPSTPTSPPPQPTPVITIAPPGSSTPVTSTAPLVVPQVLTTPGASRAPSPQPQLTPVP